MNARWHLLVCRSLSFSTTLGSISNSPSACFVASDGTCLRVYQAVIDARTLLAEINTASRQSAATAKNQAKNGAMQSSFMSASSGHSTNDALLAAHAEDAARLQNRFRIVSTQSTAKPGAIIELEPIKEATQVRPLSWDSERERPFGPFHTDSTKYFRIGKALFFCMLSKSSSSLLKEAFLPAAATPTPALPLLTR